MAQFLLIARFPSDDVPLRLFDIHSLAEEEAKRIAKGPLNSMYCQSFAAMFPGDSPRPDISDLVSVVVLRINAGNGYPEAIVSDVTAGEDDATPEQSVPDDSRPTPDHADHAPIPSGYVELTDPSHVLRPGVDLYLSFTKGLSGKRLWMPVADIDSDTKISSLSQSYRFICPGPHHPGKLASAPDVKPAASDDLPHDHHMTYATVLDLRGKVEQLQAENDRWALKHAGLKSLNTASEQQIATERQKVDELRALNTELHKRVTALRGSEQQATRLEKLATETAIRLVGQYERIASRYNFAHDFGAEGLMDKSYGKALAFCRQSLQVELEAFIDKFQHVLPHIPEEFHPDCCSDDGDGEE